MLSFLNKAICRYRIFIKIYSPNITRSPDKRKIYFLFSGGFVILRLSPFEHTVMVRTFKISHRIGKCINSLVTSGFINRNLSKRKRTFIILTGMQYCPTVHIPSVCKNNTGSSIFITVFSEIHFTQINLGTLTAIPDIHRNRVEFSVFHNFDTTFRIGRNYQILSYRRS